MSTPEQRKKWRDAARAAKAKKENGNGSVHDAVLYLKHAERAINKALREGHIKKLSRANLLTLLALGALQGD